VGGDARTREVWISRAVPRDAVLRMLIQALEFIDETAERAPATLRVVRDG
jgi:hypothetical protein